MAPIFRKNGRSYWKRVRMPLQMFLAFLCGYMLRGINEDFVPDRQIFSIDLMDQSSAPATPSAIHKLEPISCPSFLEQVRTKTYPTPVIDMNEGQNLTRLMLLKPFSMSFHVESFDKVRYGTFKSGRYYEKQLEQAWLQVLTATSLETTPNVRVLDVGGNIGYYSLLSAASGPVLVDSFEPNPQNILRFCESIVMNGWSNEDEGGQRPGPRITIYPYGIGDQTGTLPFWTTTAGNPGAGSFHEQDTNLKPDALWPVVKLDDYADQRGWLSTAQSAGVQIAILKIDVEHFEANVILGARRLLESRIIQNVFTEVSFQNKNEVEALGVLMDAGYVLHKWGTWPGPGTPALWKTTAQLPDLLLKEMRAKDAPYLNLWWILKPKQMR